MLVHVLGRPGVEAEATHLLFSKAQGPKSPNHTDKKQHVKVPRCTASTRHHTDRSQAISFLFIYREETILQRGQPGAGRSIYSVLV